MKTKEKLPYKIKIDTSIRYKKEVVLLKEDKVLGRRFGDVDVVTSIKELLEEHDLKPSDISKYIPNLGPGSFTGLKVGVTIANVLNWINGNKELEELDIPKYGAEPRGGSLWARFSVYNSIYMKILVTGAAGFIGSHTCERLKKLGHDVTGIDNYSPYYSVELKRSNAKTLEEKGINVIERDIFKDDLTDIIKDVEVVFHFAAKPGIDIGAPIEPYVENNIYGTENLYLALKDSPTFKYFIFASTSSVYGAFATEDETAAPKPDSHYGATKLCAEQLLLGYQRDRGFPVTSMRFFSIYGPRERPDKLFTKLIDSIMNDWEFPLYEGSKDHLRSYTYIGDIVDGLMLVLENPKKCIGEIFNLGIDSTITTGRGIEIVEEIIGKKAKFDVKPKRPGDQMKTETNVTKARTILGYNPTTTPEEGLKKQVEWYKDKVWNKIKLY